MRIVVVGPVVPPVHGASIVTTAMIGLFRERGHTVRVLDTTPAADGSRLAWHLGRLRAFFANLGGVLGEARGTTVYFAPSGGLGLFYDTMVTIGCRVRRHRLIFHHHSAAYVDRPNALMRAIVALAGAQQRHVVLSPGMGQRFAARYGARLAVTTVSNLAFLDPNAPAIPPRSGPVTVGFLSNIVLEKGIDRFLDIMAELAARSSTARGIIAGPFVNRAARAYVEGRLGRLANVSYAGPLYGPAKLAFFRGLDLFVFPSRYGDEAAPLVVYEAQLAGIRVAVTARGCLTEMVGPEDVLLDPVATDITPVVEAVLAMEGAPSAVDSRRQVMRDRLVEARTALNDWIAGLA